MNIEKSTTTNKTNVLFVCLGNICRSPAAEGIFSHLVEERGLTDWYEIDSAGTAGYHVGELPDHRMRTHGVRRGYNFSSHSRKFSIHDFNRFDLIVVMDDNNYQNVTALALDLDERQKVYRMTDFLSRHTADHIPDPYYSGAEGFELVLDLLEDACDGLLNELEIKRLSVSK